MLEYPIDDDLDVVASPDTAAYISRCLGHLDLGPADDLAERFSSQAGPSSPRSLAFSELGRCPGTKAGGRPAFDRGDRRLHHLVTLSSWEFDAASFRRWVPVEDQRLLARPGEAMAWKSLAGSPDFYPLREPTGMRLGRTQRAHVYVCRDREPWEVVASIGD